MKDDPRKGAENQWRASSVQQPYVGRPGFLRSVIEPHIPQAVDWFQVMVDLHQAGLSTREIGEIIDVPTTRARGWRQYGHEPRHGDGQRLLLLWHEVIGKRQETAT